MKWRPIIFLLVLVAIIWGAYYLVSNSSLFEGQRGDKPLNLDGIEVPAPLSNLSVDEKGHLIYTTPEGKTIKYIEKRPDVPEGLLTNRPTGTENGLKFNFRDESFNGTLYYGLIPEKPELRQTVFFKKESKIENGVAEIDIAENLAGKYDLTGWGSSGKLQLACRIVSENGHLLHNSRVNVSGKGPFTVEPTIIAGPYISCQAHDSIAIRVVTDTKVSPELNLADFSEASINRSSNKIDDYGYVHEYLITGLSPAKTYPYTITHGSLIHHDLKFSTAPEPGDRKAFTFAFASDSRAGKGGGERDVYGTNAYVVNRIMAEGYRNGAAFFQFTGDLINGYTPNRYEMLLQYLNWQHAVEPYANDMALNVGFGNHENFAFAFDDGSEDGVLIDRFPYNNNSSESIFNSLFTNPLNGPGSEDGSTYDPNPTTTDFPSYRENVFWYQYANTAIVVLNSNYWYTPATELISWIGGNPHGYIMDRQLLWLKETLAMLEANNTVDHIFVTLHTPLFPNGGHADDDMWYGGNNAIRPYIGGKAHTKGIIERRDEILQITANESAKTVAILCGDEHNYSRLAINNNTPRYPKNYEKKRVTLNRSIWQITNGAAGAPYYGQEKLPWSGDVNIFTAQFAVCLFQIEGDSVFLETKNPFTGVTIEKVQLK
jgi:hypothetical protein